MAGYYYLVATLNEYSLSGDSKQLDFLSIREEIISNLSKKDTELMRLLLSYWDIQNLLSELDSRENQYSYIGNYSMEEIGELSRMYRDLIRFGEMSSEERLLEQEQEFDNYSIELSDVFSSVFKAMRSRYDESTDLDEAQESHKSQKSIATLLFESYYKKLEKSNNKFLKQWGEFDRSIKNLAAAYEARKLSKPINNVLVGKGVICKAIVDNIKTEDFGLNEQEWVSEIIKLISSKDIIKKERSLDVLRWNKIDVLNTFDYFNISYVLGYVLKLTMIGRWLQLDEKTGREMFNQLVGQITSSDLVDVEL